MPIIKLRPKIKSGLCVGVSANVYDNELLKITIGNVGSLDRALTIAMKCYEQEIMDATILFSSNAVEYAINMDKKMQKLRQKQISDRNPIGWLMLNEDTLRKASTQKLPVKKLLDSNETIKNPKFINRRNQIAHGEYRDYLSSMQVNSDVGFALHLSDYIHIPKEDALDQFKKCSAFIIEWIDQNPDVISLSIKKI